MKTKHEHLTLTTRRTIESSLDNRLSFKKIAAEIGADCTTISKEVRLRKEITHTGAPYRKFNNCIHRKTCKHRLVCPTTNDCGSRKHCAACGKCIPFCSEYEADLCSKLLHPPYVCNGCQERNSCVLEKAIYSASQAHHQYTENRSNSRKGITCTEEELIELDKLISPLIQQGQSVHHIYINHRDEIMFAERSIYRFVDSNILTARNIDMPRVVRFKPRRSNHTEFKVNKRCREGRTYKDYLEYMSEHPGTATVQMDSVIGAGHAPVLLTILFTTADCMLAYLRHSNNAKSVTDIFNDLYELLGDTLFKQLFPVILTDNGPEFTDPEAIERAPDGSLRTRIFYCDPGRPDQKGAIENNHTLLRRILPKGTSFSGLTQEQIALTMSHINSYTRQKLGNKTPIDMFSLLYGSDILPKLGITKVDADDLLLRPLLLKR